MDQFYSALELAQRLGLTTEQFIDVWKTESLRKEPMDQFYSAWELAQLHRLTIEQFIDVRKTESLRMQQKEHDYRDMQTARGDSWQHESSQYQQLYEELKNDLNRNFQRLKSQQEQQWKLMDTRLDEMTKEFRSGLESLSSLASNIGESNAGAIKLCFMQELELVKQDIMKVIKTDHIGSEPGHVASKVSFQQGGQAAAQIQTPQNASGFVKANIDAYRNMNGHSGNKLNDIMNKSAAESFSTLHQLHNHISEVSSHQLSQSQQNTACAAAALQGAVAVNRTSDTGIQQDIGGKSYANVIKHTIASNTSDFLKVSARPVDASVLYPTSLTTLSGPVEATGSFAKAVSSQLMQMQSSRASSVSPRHGSDSSSSLTKMNGRMPAINGNSSVTADSGQQMFTIENSQQFSVSDKPYLSKFMYSSGKHCRARIRLNIEATGVLAAHIHISKGYYDDSHTWPLWLSGFGQIWNISSRRYTPIWQLVPVLCQKPPSAEKEFIFKADVCLKTSRGSYSNVKYQALVDKHYAENDRLTFMWDLQAVEN